MSLLAGHLWTDPDRPLTRAVEARLARAVDGPGVVDVHVYANGPLGIAHGCRLADASRNDNFSDGGARLRIVADARLDNREELAASLGIPLALDLPDSTLILAAYRKWGRECCAKLLGDFAFALWDEAEATLLCARDLLGVRPFYYRQEPAAFSFASRAAALSGPDDRLDDGRIAAFLLGFDDDLGDTAIAAARRLPPGHWLAVQGGRVKLSAYAALAPAPDARGDFAEAFRERLTWAVASRLRGPAQVGALLSGGLDSSSIVSVAADLNRADPGFRLRTYSFGYPDNPALDESRYVRSMWAAHPLDGLIVPLGPNAPLDRLDELTQPGEDLYYAPGIPKIATLLAVAAGNGTAVVLDGHGGDEVASHGYGRLAELARERRWLALYGELRSVSATFGESPGGLLRQYFLAYAFGGRLRRLLRRVARAAGKAPRQDQLDAAFLAPDFARRSNVAARHADWRATLAGAGADERRSHYYNLTAPGLARAFEALAQIGDASGVELRFPFFDCRVVEFALTIPDNEKLRDGFSRSVLRRAMQGLLPPDIQWRRDKIDFSPEFRAALAGPAREQLSGLQRSDGPLAEYVDVRRVGIEIDRLRAGAPADTMAIWRCMLLAAWLKRRSAAAGMAKEPDISPAEAL